VADENGLRRADVVEQADEVAGQGVDVVVLDGVGSAGAAVAALLGGQHVITGLREHRYLVPPGVGQLG
jgi:precorrin-4 methylase